MTAIGEIRLDTPNSMLWLRLGYQPVAIEWHVGDVIRKLREQRRWGQGRLAKLAKVNRSTVVSVEDNAAGTQRHTYEKIARAFGLTLGELYSMIPKGTGAITAPEGFRDAKWIETDDYKGPGRRRAPREHRPVSANEA